MYRSRVFHSGVLAALLLISLNCSAQKVSTTTENRFDFKSGKRYAWGKNHIITRQGRANDALIDKKIVEEVNRNLQAKGFTEDSANPDFFVSYEAGSSDLSVAVEGAYVDHPPVSTSSVGPVYGIPQNIWYSVMAISHFTWSTPNRTKRFGPLSRRKKSAILTKA